MAVSGLGRRRGSRARWRGVEVHAVDATPPARGARACGLRSRDDAAIHPLRHGGGLVEFTTGIVALLAATSVLLLGFGANLLYLTWHAARLKSPRQPPAGHGDEPLVCVQIPVYNERYVARRVIDAVCGLEWPRDRFEVQVLDDSDDDTVAIVAGRAARWSRRGVSISHVRRGSRAGFKAGALAHGLKVTAAPLIAIFHAGFVPPTDLLPPTIGAFGD